MTRYYGRERLGDDLQFEAGALVASHALGPLVEPVAKKAVLLARVLCNTTLAALWLAHDDQRWITAAGVVGEAEARHLDRLCASAADARATVVVEDVERSPRFRGQAVARSEVRFYAGHALRASNGRTLGVICAADPAPRDLDLLGLAALASLASGVAARVERAFQEQRLGASATGAESACRVREHTAATDLRGLFGHDPRPLRKARAPVPAWARAASPALAVRG